MGLRLARTIFGLNPQPAPGAQQPDPEQGGTQTQPPPKPATPKEEIVKGLFELLEEAAKKRKKKDGG